MNKRDKQSKSSIKKKLKVVGKISKNKTKARVGTINNASTNVVISRSVKGIGVKQDTKKLGYIGKNNVDRDAWFTPSKYIESVREVLGDIDLDPFSSKEANGIVNAKRFLTIKDDAFKTKWGDKINVFMNPPYGRGICGDACIEFLKWWNGSSDSNAVVLTNNATDTKWFQAMADRADVMCFTNHRIAFYNSDGKNVSGNTRGQTFFFFGREIEKFKNEFLKYGVVMEKL